MPCSTSGTPKFIAAIRQIPDGRAVSAVAYAVHTAQRGTPAAVLPCSLIMMVVVAVALFIAVRLTARRRANIPQVGEGAARRAGLTSPT
ncbi:hypothetical protein GCM10010412_086800 [Nonomuraea recticatena]|uniref:Uncharacterized protein n=1 Tax=Nonomuraea recticatena TaxID=46178 RepID=A0ABN3T990_9ACTN